jgi:hypothetical protein
MIELVIIKNGAGYYAGERIKIAEPIAKRLIKNGIATEIKALQTTEIIEPIETTKTTKKSLKTKTK